MIAYKILGTEFCDDDNRIREAYLKKIRQYPPETNPAEYQVIRKAYDRIETSQKRLEYFLFGNDMDFTPEEYERLQLKVDKKLTKEIWEKLCRRYQEDR